MSNAYSATLIPIIERKIIPDSIIYCDCWSGYNVLDVIDFKHHRINLSKLFADKKNHINGTRAFGHRELLKLGEASYTQIQRCAKAFWTIFEGI